MSIKLKNFVNEKPRIIRIRKTLITSLGLHFLGIVWFGIYFLDSSPSLSNEGVLVVDLVSDHIEETKEFHGPNLTHKQNKTRVKNPQGNSPKNPEIVPKDSSSITTPLASEEPSKEIPVHQKEFHTTSPVLHVKDKTHSLDQPQKVSPKDKKKE